ncbi:hypothetical protein ABKN59_002059 [Abortiporus biennis]
MLQTSAEEAVRRQDNTVCTAQGLSSHNEYVSSSSEVTVFKGTKCTRSEVDLVREPPRTSHSHGGVKKHSQTKTDDEDDIQAVGQQLPRISRRRITSNGRGGHLQLRARGALDMWRLEIWKQHQYNDCIMGPKTVMSDALLRRFSSRTNMQTAEDVNMAFPGWGSARKHGLDALRVLNQVDAKFKEDKDKETEEKKLKRAKLKEQREVHVEVQVDHPEPPPHSCQYPPSNYFGYPQYPRCYSPYYHPYPPYSSTCQITRIHTLCHKSTSPFPRLTIQGLHIISRIPSYTLPIILHLTTSP